MMKQLFKHAKRASVVLLAIFVLGCGGKDETDPLPVVTSSFTQVVNNTTGVVTFTNTSTNATTYLWDLNDGTTSTAFEPVNTYTTGTYTVKLTASNAAGGTATSQNTFTVTVAGSVDTTKPIITLVGEATINLTVGDPYTDQGATANDNLDGNITASIVKGGATVNTATAGSYVITYNVKDAAGNDAITVSRTVVVVAFDSGLLANGSFSSTTDAWIGNAFNVKNEGGTNFNFANVEVAGNAYDANLSQVLTITQGLNYVLSFDASSDRARTMIAGIGLNEGAYTNDNRTIDLTTTIQTFTLNLSSLTFGGANSRVFFDMGAAVGVVVIDNVKLILGAAPTCTAETAESLAAADFNLTFKTDPGTAIINDNATYEYAANPNFTNAVNTSCFVGKSTKAAGNLYGNNQIVVNAKFDFTSHSGFKMKVYSAVAGSKVLLKLEDKTNGGIFKEVLKTVAQANVWEELTFDFASNQSNKYDRIVLFADFEGAAASTVYFDDLKLYGTGTPSSPTTSAPTPPARDPADVISIYGGAPYTNLAGTNYNPDWGQSGLAFTTPSFDPGDGNLVLAYPNFTYQGTQLAGNVDASAMNFLHVDIWVAAGTDRQVKVTPINNGETEQLVVVPLTPGAWNSVDLPKSSFTGMTWGSVYQMKFDGQFNGNGSANTTPFDIYLDNIYFYVGSGGPTCPAPPAGDFITDGDFETGTGDCWIFVNDIGINKGTVVVTNEQNNTGGGTYSVKIDTNPFGNPAIKKERFGVGTILPSTSYQVKLDSRVQTLADGAVVNVLAFSEKTVGGAVLHNLGSINTTPGSWNTKTATFTTDADVSGGVSLLIEVVCGGAGTCDGVVYFDNISFILD